MEQLFTRPELRVFPLIYIDLWKQKYSKLDKNSSDNNTIQIVSNTQSEK